jgi:lysozyme
MDLSFNIRHIFNIYRFYLKNKIAFYYAMHFHKHTEQNLKNSKTEVARIEKIITEYNDKTFGLTFLTIKKKEDINGTALLLQMTELIWNL